MSGFFAKLFSHHKEEAPAEEATPERKFWDWFVAHADKLRTTPLDEFSHIDDDGFLSLDLISELGEVAFGLDYEMRDGGANEPRELIFTADGDPELFPVVHRLAEAAPAGMTGWRVTTLRARSEGDGEIGFFKINGVKLKHEDLYFVLRPETGPDGRVGIDLYHKRFAEVGPESAWEAANYFLSSVLGEQAFEARVGEIGTHEPPLLGAPAFGTIRPFAELPAAFDALTTLGDGE